MAAANPKVVRAGDAPAVNVSMDAVASTIGRLELQVMSLREQLQQSLSHLVEQKRKAEFLQAKLTETQERLREVTGEPVGDDPVDVEANREVRAETSAD